LTWEKAGHSSFASSDAREALGVSAHASKLALNRRAQQKIFASPARRFYVGFPSEYRSLGFLLADQFVPALMQRQGALVLCRAALAGQRDLLSASTPLSLLANVRFRSFPVPEKFQPEMNLSSALASIGSAVQSHPASTFVMLWPD